MAQSEMKRLRALTDQLNQYRYEYYDLNAPTVDDGEYDRLFDELAGLEKSLGTQMGNSPTQTVGWPARDSLAKASHPIPLLSLDKTKQVDEFCSFIGDQPVMLMLKLDGLTIKVTYEQGIILEAATRGDGNVGENVTHNVRGISGIPSRIPYKGPARRSSVPAILRCCRTPWWTAMANPTKAAAISPPGLSGF